MTKCPKCGFGDAEIGLIQVYCINVDCQWFDEDQLNMHMEDCRKYTDDASNDAIIEEDTSLSDDTIDAILNRLYGANMP